MLQTLTLTRTGTRTALDVDFALDAAFVTIMATVFPPLFCAWAEAALAEND